MLTAFCRDAVSIYIVLFGFKVEMVDFFLNTCTWNFGEGYIL